MLYASFLTMRFPYEMKTDVPGPRSERNWYSGACTSKADQLDSSFGGIPAGGIRMVCDPQIYCNICTCSYSLLDRDG